ncbi:polyamine ABC transporter substrate-binding protein [Amaricoccus sp.]|uniref:polyamine ABC transporter substrate-binding protein n=1 Tax=Amaricoccus sp. TaxID=1872485 RepID=UPI001D2F9BE9|nr:polyamine ABC transporter substrate-binding protein [Amaricoccus sp.]MCB1403225.1 polyamine ABC transporter substrate-binding protein [Paracoccaceae bacterium]HRW15235.1 polyamine ABC transporter substrate-binding protein [Amaricoccus sp.]
MRPKGIALLALALAAGAPAEAGGVLRVFNWSNYIADDTIAAFEAATGIEVIYTTYDSMEELEFSLLTGVSGADIVVPSSDFLRRAIKNDVFMPLDRDRIPNWRNLDPGQMAKAAAYDPGNAHAAIYLWGTTGLGYNVDEVRRRLGPDAPVDSWSLIFNPHYAAKLADCGITMLDSPVEVLPAVLKYLGLDPATPDPDALARAEEALDAIKPFVRDFNSARYIDDLASGSVCLSFGWSGDVFMAAERAEAAGNGVQIGYAIPKEGAQQWFDMMAIPAEAPNPEAAHAFIDFVLRPEIMAGITNYVYFPNAVTASQPYVDEAIRENAEIYPPGEVLDALFPAALYDAATQRSLARLWTRMRTGQ